MKPLSLQPSTGCFTLSAADGSYVKKGSKKKKKNQAWKLGVLTPFSQPWAAAAALSALLLPPADRPPPPRLPANWSQFHSCSPYWCLGFGGFLSQGAELPPRFLALQVGGENRALPDPTSAFSVPPSTNEPQKSSCLTLVSTGSVCSCLSPSGAALVHRLWKGRCCHQKRKSKFAHKEGSKPK